MNVVSVLDLSNPGAIELFPEQARWGADGLRGYGFVRTATFVSTLAYSYQGVDLFPVAAGASVAIGRSGQPYGWRGDDAWQPVESPEFHYLNQDFRDRLSRWAGSIQFWIQLEPETIVRELRLAYSLPIHDIPSYLRDFALPAIAQQPVELCRDVRPNISGVIALPEGIASDRIASALFLSPGISTFSVRIQNGEKRLFTEPAAPAEPGKLLLQYRMAARGTDDNFDQIDDAPMVLIREIRREDVRYPIARSGPAVAISNTTARRQDTESFADSIFEIQILARRSDDARFLATQVRGHMAAAGEIPCPPYGVFISVAPEGAVDFMGSTRAIGDLDRASFRLRAYQIPQSVITTEVPLITEVGMGWPTENGGKTGQNYPLSWVV